MKCSQCGYDNRPGVKFCGRCGTPAASFSSTSAGTGQQASTAAKIKCSSCGAVIPNGKRFCVRCGKRVGKAGAGVKPAYFDLAMIDSLRRPIQAVSSKSVKPVQAGSGSLWPIILSAVLLVVYTFLTGNITAPIVGLGIAWALHRFGCVIQALLKPLWPVRNLLPRKLRVGG